MHTHNIQRQLVPTQLRILLGWSSTGLRLVDGKQLHASQLTPRFNTGLGKYSQSNDPTSFDAILVSKSLKSLLIMPWVGSSIVWFGVSGLFSIFST